LIKFDKVDLKSTARRLSGLFNVERERFDISLLVVFPRLVQSNGSGVSAFALRIRDRYGVLDRAYTCVSRKRLFENRIGS